MAVHNVHERLLAATAGRVGALLDSLSGDDDRLWPHHGWPPMRFDRPLGEGAVGGHGPVRYTVTAYTPATRVRFTFTGPRGFDGFHEFTVLAVDEGHTLLRHTLAMRARGPGPPRLAAGLAPAARRVPRGEPGPGRTRLHRRGGPAGGSRPVRDAAAPARPLSPATRPRPRRITGECGAGAW